MKHYLACWILMLFLSCSIPGWAAGDIDPRTYPEIGDKELGQLLWALKVADQPIPDYSLIRDEHKGADDGMRYTIAFTAYFLALEQYHKLSAWAEVIQPALDRLIQKMIYKSSWEYWAEISQGLRHLEPLLNKPYPESHNPIEDQNIMYSGHLGHMIGLYEMLYRDFKWDEPGSIVFAWSEHEKYVYDNHQLQRIMYEQMKYNPWHSIACEPNAVFPSCNQHPIMSFILYDHTHATNLSEVQKEFLNFFLKQRLIDPITHHAAAYYLVKQEVTVTGYGVGISASMDGWIGMFMHAWQPEYIARHYPYQRRDHIIWENDQEARLRPDYGPGQSLKYGYFATLAAELGDLATRDKLVAYADKVYEPEWQGLAYVYPINKPGTKLPGRALTGVLLALARANMENGIAQMHNQPFDDQHFQEPRVEGVDFPNVLLRRAIYDRAKKALVVSTVPGAKEKGNTEIRLARLDQNKSYALYLDGALLQTCKNSETISVKIPLDSGHDLVLVEEEQRE